MQVQKKNGTQQGLRKCLKSIWEGEGEEYRRGGEKSYYRSYENSYLFVWGISAYLKLVESNLVPTINPPLGFPVLYMNDVFSMKGIFCCVYMKSSKLS